MPRALALALAALALGGAALRLWAVVHLGQSFSYDVKRPAGGELVRTGPHRLIRHPAYLGLLLVSSLPGLAVGSGVGFVGLATTTLWSVVVRVRAEGALMEPEFGDRFRAYARRTWRLLPLIY